MSDTGWKGLWRLCQVILLLLHVWFGKCQVVPACHVEDCYPLKESSDAVQLPLWRAFQARTVKDVLGPIPGHQESLSAIYMTSINNTFSVENEVNTSLLSPVVWCYKDDSTDTYRTVPSGLPGGTSPIAVALDSWLRLQVNNASYIKSLDSVLLEILTVLSPSNATAQKTNCKCSVHRLNFSTPTEPVEIDLRTRIEVLPETYSTISSLLSFATKSQHSASSTVRGVNLTSFSQLHGLHGDLTLFDIEHYGIAVTGVSSEAGTWKAAHRGSKHLDMELTPGAHSPPMLLGPGSVLGFSASIRIGDVCSRSPPSVTFLPWQLGLSPDFNGVESMIVIDMADLGCKTQKQTDGPMAPTMSLEVPGTTASSMVTQDQVVTTDLRQTATATQGTAHSSVTEASNVAGNTKAQAATPVPVTSPNTVPISAPPVVMDQLPTTTPTPIPNAVSSPQTQIVDNESVTDRTRAVEQDHTTLYVSTNSSQTVETTSASSASVDSRTITTPQPAPATAMPYMFVTTALPTSEPTTAQSPTTVTPTPDTGKPAYHCSHPPSLDLPSCNLNDGFLVPSVLTASPSIAIIPPNTYTAAIRIYWSGWRGDIQNYHFEYFPMRINKTSNKLKLAPGPIFELDFYKAPRGPFTVHLPQGIYSFVLTVVTAGNHTQLARQLVLVADYSAANLEIVPKNPIKIDSLQHWPWKNSKEDLQVSWHGHFMNRFIVRHPHYLLPVQNIPGLLSEYDQAFGQLSVHGTPNDQGVISFAYVVCSVHVGKKKCKNGWPSPRLTSSVSLRYPELLVTGSTLDIQIYAGGVLGGSVSSTVTLYVDLTPPTVWNTSLYSGISTHLLVENSHISELIPGDSSRSSQTSSNLILMMFSAVDRQSGIEKVNAAVSPVADLAVQQERRIPVVHNTVSKATCKDPLQCSCAMDKELCQMIMLKYVFDVPFLRKDSISERSVETKPPTFDNTSDLGSTQLLSNDSFSEGNETWAVTESPQSDIEVLLTLLVSNRAGLTQNATLQLPVVQLEYHHFQLPLFARSESSTSISVRVDWPALRAARAACLFENTSIPCEGLTDAMDTVVVLCKVSSTNRTTSCRQRFMRHGSSVLWTRLDENTHYAVQVRSTAGLRMSSVSAMHTLEDVPASPPQSLQVRGIDKTSALVTWAPPRESDRNGKIIGYTLFYGVSSASRNLSEKVYIATHELPKGSKHYWRYSNLVPGQEYFVNISASTAVGEGPRTEAVVFTAYEAVPSESPSHLRMVESSDSSLTVRWDPVVTVFQNGRVTHHEVVLDMLQSNVTTSAIKLEITDHTNQVTFHHLYSYTSYTVQVRARNSAGFGPFSKPLVLTTEESLALPPSPATLVTGPDSAFVSWQWDPLSSHGILLAQDIHYKLSGDTTAASLVIRVPPTQWFIHLTNLTAGSKYELHLGAATSAGWGGLSSPSKFILPAPDISSVGKVSLVSSSNSTLHVTWDIPKETGVVTNASRPHHRTYIITYFSVSPSCPLLHQPAYASSPIHCQTSNPVSIKVNVNSVFLVGLASLTFYNISVQCCGTFGLVAPFSAHTIQQTLPSDLEATELKVLSSTSHSIRICWSTTHPEQRELQHVDFLVIATAMSSGSSVHELRQIANSSVVTTSNPIIHWTVGELQGDTLYRVTVQVYRGMQLSHKALSVTAYTLPAAPSRLVTASATFMPGYGVQVEWLASDVEQSPVYGYIVTLMWQPIQNGTSGKSAALPVDNLRQFLHQKTHRLFSAGQRLLIVRDIPVNSTAMIFVTPWYMNSNGEIITAPSTNAGSLNTTVDRMPRLAILHTAGTSNGHGLNVTWRDRDTDRLQVDNTSLYYIARALLFGSCNSLVSDMAPLNLHEVHAKNPDFNSDINTEFDDLQPYSKYSVEVSRIVDSVDPVSGMAQYHYQTADTVVACTGEAAPSSGPQLVKAEAVASRQLTVEWSPPDSKDVNGYLQDYLLVYAESHDSSQRRRRSVLLTEQVQKNMSVPRRVHLALLKDLLPWTQYTVNAYARTAAGTSPATQLTVQTLEDDPEIYAVEIINKTSSSFHLSWKLYPNSRLKSLKVVLLPTGTGSNLKVRAVTMVEFTDSRPRLYSHARHGLFARTSYEATVSVTTSVGRANSSVSFTTLESVPSEVPEVKCQSYHVNKKMFVNLTWKAIPERSVNGRLLGHVIHYGITNRSQANYWSENVSAIDHHLLIDSLTEPGYYSFYVAGATAAGVGKQSEPCQLKLLSSSGRDGDRHPNFNDSAPDWMWYSIAMLPVLIIILAVTIFLVRRKQSIYWRVKRQPQEVIANPLNLIPLHTYSMYQTCRGVVYDEAANQAEIFQQLAEYRSIQIERSRLRNQKSIAIGNLVSMFTAKLEHADPVFKSPSTTTHAIVKQLHRTSDSEGAAQMQVEIEALRTFQHKNIIQLIGVCTLDIPQLIVLENMSKGDLKAFLMSCRGTPTSAWGLTLPQQLYIIYQCSCALQYLAKSCFVHGDIAARNFLVGVNMEVKLADFGLNQGLYCEDYYSSGPDTSLIPLRWMSPEALFEGIFTSSGDIWSFGVLMWEVFSFGQQPYPDYTNIELLVELRDHFYPDKPHRCPQYAYELMEACWHKNASSRPGADILVKEILHFMATHAPEQGTGDKLVASDDLILLYGQLNELIDVLEDVETDIVPRQASVLRGVSCPSKLNRYSMPKRDPIYDEIVLKNQPAVPPPRGRRHSVPHAVTMPTESGYLTSADSVEAMANYNRAVSLSLSTEV